MKMTCELCDTWTDHTTCEVCDETSYCEQCLSCWEPHSVVEMHECQSCDKMINTEEDAFTIIDDSTYECWNCYCFPPGR